MLQNGQKKEKYPGFTVGGQGGSGACISTSLSLAAAHKCPGVSMSRLEA